MTKSEHEIKLTRASEVCIFGYEYRGQYIAIGPVNVSVQGAKLQSPIFMQCPGVSLAGRVALAIKAVDCALDDPQDPDNPAPDMKVFDLAQGDRDDVLEWRLRIAKKPEEEITLEG